MKAIQLDEALNLGVAEIPTPEPQSHEVLVRFEASTINPADLKVRTGAARPRAGGFPYTLGWDLVGVVESGSGFAAGTRVTGFSAMASTGHGTWSEYVSLSASSLTVAPEGIEPAVLAQLPLVGSTALRAVEIADPTEHDEVVVAGGAGAVGNLVVQLLLARGIRPRVLVRDPADPGELLEQLRPRLAALVAEVEPRSTSVLIDAAGLDLSAALRPGGRYVAVVPGREPAAADGDDITVTVVRVPESGAAIASLLELVGDGTLRLGDPERFPLLDPAGAFAAFERRSGRRIALVGAPSAR